MRPPEIELKGLTKSFFDKKVLDGLHLKVQESETIVILGPSGCGKSVTLKLLAGLLLPDSGSILFRGEDLHSMSPLKKQTALNRIGMLFQNAALFDSMNLFDNVAFPLRQRGELDEKTIANTVVENLSLVGLNGQEKLMPSELSGGMRKRAGLARAIVSRPSILLYDEPTTGLDPIRSTEIDQLILKLQKELKVTSIVITHDIKSAFCVADRVGLHFDGQIQTILPVSDFQHSNDEAIVQFLKGNSQGPIRV